MKTNGDKNNIFSDLGITFNVFAYIFLNLKISHLANIRNSNIQPIVYVYS